MAAKQVGDWSKKWAGIVAQAWGDENFKKRLLADPAGVLHGMQAPAGARLRIVEDSDTVVHLRLPQKPSSNELAEEELLRVAGGGLCVRKAGG